jgi:AcrR family transcriptional regulator
MAGRGRTAADRRGALHPNAQRLLDATVELLESTPIEQVTLAEVLARSGVSNGSLYHHFEDFPDLVERAVVQRYVKGLEESLAAVEALLDSADAAEFRRRVEEIVVVLHAQDRRPFRLVRLETLGALSSRPRLAERISRAQHESTMRQAGFLAEFQDRGWLRSDLSAMAISTFMTATFLGRVVDDIADGHVDPDEWTEVAMVAFRAFLFGD